jgi:hypothetical protein
MHVDQKKKLLIEIPKNNREKDYQQNPNLKPIKKAIISNE